LETKWENEDWETGKWGKGKTWERSAWEKVKLSKARGVERQSGIGENMKTLGEKCKMDINFSPY
jgi:hypothetical protein